MLKQKKLYLLVFALGLMALITLGAISLRRVNNRQNYIKSQTVTIFVHGWGSNYTAEEHMANAAKRAGATDTIVRADVSKAGKVQFLGQINKHATNPIIEVNLADNKTPEGTEKAARVRQLYHQSGHYIKDVVLALKTKYKVRSINLVGHSMGNLLNSYYILDNVADYSLPVIKHQVVIAGHYDGIKAMQPYSLKSKLNRQGRPSVITPEYAGLLKLRQKFPKSTKVLNIYGDIGDRYHSDGQVTTTSAKSYRYLAHRAASYSEYKVTGNGARHSQLHENGNADAKIIEFLWGK